MTQANENLIDYFTALQHLRETEQRLNIEPLERADDCPTPSELIQTALGEAASERAAWVEQHAAECAYCSAALDAQRAALTNDLPLELPEDAEDLTAEWVEGGKPTPSAPAPKTMDEWIAEEISRLMDDAESGRIPAITVDDKRAIVNEVWVAATFTEYRGADLLSFYRAAAEAVRKHVIDRAEMTLSDLKKKAAEASKTAETTSSTFAGLEASTVSMARLEPGTVLEYAKRWTELNETDKKDYDIFALYEFAGRSTKEIALLLGKEESEVQTSLDVIRGTLQTLVSNR